MVGRLVTPPRTSPMTRPSTSASRPTRATSAAPREGLRPLRDPATVHLDEDDEGTGE
ncbi:hypothetical protein SAZ11_02140 [Streptomyces sp. FXJ1.4098]|nr:hypothetical protein [Streptomyces sp. FXJ1.4098]